MDAAESGARLEANKKTVLEFYDCIVNAKDPEAALRYMGASYRQHNPTVGDGAEGLVAFIERYRTQHPGARSEFKRVIAEGDYVVVHAHAMPPSHPRGLAIVEIFRLDEGKVVEHWDVIQEIPEHSANPNGMF